MMHFSLAQLRQRYNRIAPYLPQAAALDRHVSNNMLQRLPFIIHQPLQIVDVGSGLGMGAQRLAALYPDAHIVALDIAEELLKAGQRKAQQEKSLLEKIKAFGRTSRLSYVAGDMANLPFPSASVDMIWSNLALPWQSTPDAFLSECRRVLKPNGLLMFSTLGVDSMMLIKQAFQSIDVYPSTHEFIDMHDLGDALLQYGFYNPVIDVERLTLTYPDLPRLVQDFRENAATNLHPKRRRGLLTPRLWKKVLAAFESLRGRDGLILVGVEVVYGHAWRGEEKSGKPSSSEQIIQFHPPNARQSVMPL
ncbi:MAG: methyltransferase domain-containing protein [Neisseriaceae bacterium]|nr:methyltransferase domain-containing protein [Neisseriaceae bacterium]